MSYKKQSKSLSLIQVKTRKYELAIREHLGWNGGKICYHACDKYTYKMQVDAYWPNDKTPEAFVSVTCCDADIRGHSNENKLQLKLGELILLKAAYPEIRAIIVIEGFKDAWLPYVLHVFNVFYDEVIFAWEESDISKLERIKLDPLSVKLKHSQLWKSLADEFNAADINAHITPIKSSIRQTIFGEAKKEKEIKRPSDIKNKVLKLCMEEAFKKKGLEWNNFLAKKWDLIQQSRSFFNPGEAAIHLTLTSQKIAFLGGIAKDVAVPSLIHQFGGKEVQNTKVSEDFILYSNAKNCPIFIQSKSSGGGVTNHGKNIQNRTKEQIARSMFYRGFLYRGNICLRKKDFVWIGVLDGDWGVTKSTPLKYLHMLAWAGYDHLIPADSMLNKNNQYKENNLLKTIIAHYDCETDLAKLNEKWTAWLKRRKPKVSSK